MTTPSPEMAKHLEYVVDGLVNQTGGLLHRGQLRETVYACYDQLAEHATVTTFLPVLTGRFALAQVRAQQILSGDLLKEQPEVLIIDEHNAARSQTAAALIRFYAPGRYQVISAGVHPSGGVDQGVVDLLDTVGVRLTDFPKPFTPELLGAADHIIVIGHEPLDLPAAVVGEVRWDISDPQGADAAETRAILTSIDADVRKFLRGVDPEHELHAPVLTVED